MMSRMNSVFYDYIVVGGGIAAVSCAEQLLLSSPPHHTALLVSAHPAIKRAVNLHPIAQVLTSFDVEETAASSLQTPRLSVHIGEVHSFDKDSRTIACSNGHVFRYHKICFCTGGKPKLIAPDNPYVFGVRDVESIENLRQKLQKARTVVILGNGGIASELVYEIRHCRVVWLVKHSNINAAFLDPAVSEFFLDQLDKVSTEQPVSGVTKRMHYTTNELGAAGDKASDGRTSGAALGPDWCHLDLDPSSFQSPIPDHSATQSSITGSDTQPLCSETSASRNEAFHRRKNLYIEYNALLKDIVINDSQDAENEAWEDCSPFPITVVLSNDKQYPCDFIVSATGVNPRTDIFKESCPVDAIQDLFASDGGIIVDQEMRVKSEFFSGSDIFAAGDVCTPGWQAAPLWSHMRLWTQAHQMGAYAGRCMSASLDDMGMDLCFELFTHVTKFFGFKVILLGKYNERETGAGLEILVRVTPGVEMIKCVLKHGKMIGAILVGETDYEETMENLIINQLDLTPFKDDLLDPNIDITDFFD